MTDRVLRQLVVTLTMLAVLAVVLQVPSLLRTPAVIAFAMLAPGLAVSRHVATLHGIDRFALAGAASLALNVVASLLLIAIGKWRGEPVLAVLVALTLALTFIPLQAPWTRRRDRQDRLRNEQIRARRESQDRAYEQVVSSNPDNRRTGLMALSWLLEDDGRSAEAARLRALSRLEVPPQLPLGRNTFASDAQLHEAHRAARSDDPETRREGLFSIAALLDDSGRADEAATLRELAQGDHAPDR